MKQATRATCPWWKHRAGGVDGPRSGVCHHVSVAMGAEVQQPEGWRCSEHPDRRLPPPPSSLDMVAAMAMQGMVANLEGFCDRESRAAGYPDREVIAVNAYDFAEAFLAEAERRRAARPGAEASPSAEVVQKTGPARVEIPHERIECTIADVEPGDWLESFTHGGRNAAERRVVEVQAARDGERHILGGTLFSYVHPSGRRCVVWRPMPRGGCRSRSGTSPLGIGESAPPCPVCAGTGLAP